MKRVIFACLLCTMTVTAVFAEEPEALNVQLDEVVIEIDPVVLSRPAEEPEQIDYLKPRKSNESMQYAGPAR
jgi:hypothetical protein